MTDVPMFQQASAIRARLQGHARQLAALIPTSEIVGGVFLEDGTYVDPVSNLLAQLNARFAAYPHEERNEAMLEVWHFQRRQGENIDSLIS